VTSDAAQAPSLRRSKPWPGRQAGRCCRSMYWRMEKCAFIRACLHSLCTAAAGLPRHQFAGAGMSPSGMPRRHLVTRSN